MTATIAPTLPPAGILLRTYGAGLAANLPLLALLLTPQLMRSRAGSEALLAVGTVLLIALVVAAVVVAPEVSARVAPGDGGWRFGTARLRVRELRRQHRRPYVWRLGEFVALYAVAQGVGGVVVWLLPNVSPDPAFGVDPAAGRWVIDYPNFAVQAVSIYLVLCLATAWYACRVRQLALRHLPDD